MIIYQQKITLNVLKNIGTFVAGAIPILQLVYQWFPQQISLLFINEKYILFTTTITFLLSVFFILFSISKGSINIKTLRRIVPDKEFGGKRRMTRFIALRTVAGFAVPSVFLSAILFMYLADFNSEVLAVLQAAAYIFTFSVSTFIVVSFTLDISDRKNYEETKKERPRLAINLAKESDGFDIFPRINFLSAKEDTNARQYIVEVKIQDKKYRIVTNSAAETLYAVYPVVEKEKTMSNNI